MFDQTHVLVYIGIYILISTVICLIAYHRELNK